MTAADTAADVNAYNNYLIIPKLFIQIYACLPFIPYCKIIVQELKKHNCKR